MTKTADGGAETSPACWYRAQAARVAVEQIIWSLRDLYLYLHRFQTPGTQRIAFIEYDN